MPHQESERVDNPLTIEAHLKLSARQHQQSGVQADEHRELRSGLYLVDRRAIAARSRSDLLSNE